MFNISDSQGQALLKPGMALVQLTNVTVKQIDDDRAPDAGDYQILFEFTGRQVDDQFKPVEDVNKVHVQKLKLNKDSAKKYQILINNISHILMGTLSYEGAPVITAADYEKDKTSGTKTVQAKQKEISEFLSKRLTSWVESVNNQIFAGLPQLNKIEESDLGFSGYHQKLAENLQKYFQSNLNQHNGTCGIVIVQNTINGTKEFVTMPVWNNDKTKRPYCKDIYNIKLLSFDPKKDVQHATTFGSNTTSSGNEFSSEPSFGQISEIPF